MNSCDRFSVISSFILVENFDNVDCIQALKNDIKQREGMWSSVYWEVIEPAVKIRTMRARLASSNTCALFFVTFLITSCDL